MKESGNFLRKALLWVGLPVLIILALLGLIVLKDIIPGRAAVHFGFAGWSNSPQGRIAVLSISNRLPEPVIYFADRDRQPRCDLMVVASRQKQGMHEWIVYTNLMQEVWTGHLPLQLPPQTGVDCLLPWSDQFTNGQITFSYLPEPDLLQRMRERLAKLLNREAGRPWKSVPLTGAPWTNAATIP